MADGAVGRILHGPVVLYVADRPVTGILHGPVIFDVTNGPIPAVLDGPVRFDMGHRSISGTPIEGSSFKSASVYNCQYIGSGKVAAYVGVVELMGDNPYTARNSMAVMIDLNNRTIKKIEGIPYSDGHSTAIEFHDGEVLFSSFGVDKAGVFAYNPASGTVRQVISLSGNLNYIHFFE